MRYSVLMLLVYSLLAQEPRFGAQSRLVMMPVTVDDRSGHPVEGLEAADFIVLDEGRPQKVLLDTFGTGVAPIALVIAVQASDISAAVLENVWKIGPMIQPLITGESGCAAVVAFSERVDWLQECTKDPDAITRALRRIQPSGEVKTGRMLDASLEAIERLRKRPTDRRVLLLISESRDRGSDADLNTVAEAAQNAGVTVYAATYSAFKTAFTTRASAIGKPRPPKVPLNPHEQTNTRDGSPAKKYDPYVPPPEQRADLLAALTELFRLRQPVTTDVLSNFTGGETYSFTRGRTLQEVIEKLGQDLHTQYIVSFRPESPEAGFHRLDVEVTRKGNYRVRTRPGYWWSAER